MDDSPPSLNQELKEEKISSSRDFYPNSCISRTGLGMTKQDAHLILVAGAVHAFTACTPCSTLEFASAEI